MALNAKKKGSKGERECARWLKETLDLDYLPERNLEQVRHGGYDLIVKDFVIEVKRCQVLHLRQWWLQVVTASKEIIGAEPIVIYRQNNQPWRILISARHIGCTYGYLALGTIESKQWLKQRYALTTNISSWDAQQDIFNDYI